MKTNDDEKTTTTKTSFSFPRKRHAHRCPACARSWACYKKHCDKGSRILITQCPFHSPNRSPYAEKFPKINLLQ